MAERILQDSNRSAEKHPRNGISPAHTEIDRHQQGQVNQLRPAAVLVQERLQDQRQKRRDDYRAAVIFVDFDIRFGLRPGIEHVGHRSVFGSGRRGGRRLRCGRRRGRLRRHRGRRGFLLHDSWAVRVGAASVG